MFKLPKIICFLTSLILSVCTFIQASEVKTEVREIDGKEVTYMFIGGIKVHETDPAKQPFPPVVEPKSYDVGKAKAPENAVVLFDGSQASINNWSAMNGQPTQWKLKDGALVSNKGNIRSKQEFGSCKVYLEFATPKSGKGTGQGSGNSGVFLMGRYEIQILNSFGANANSTYPDGQCGALYGRSKPLVNASRAPGEWQSYEIDFTRPLFDKDGKVTRKAKFTVVHNGHLIHDNLELSGGTGWAGPHAVTPYRQHGDKGPLSLQDHRNPVRYRNIWAIDKERKSSFFSTQKVLKALFFTGGCCHDYGQQKNIIIEGINERVPTQWEVFHEMDEKKSKAFLNRKGWADPFDYVVYDQCYASEKDVQFIESVTAVHEAGKPALALHCAMHSYHWNVPANEGEIKAWPKMLGASSKGHGPRIPVTVSIVPENAKHPVIKDLPDGWRTPEGELYNVQEIYPGTTVLAYGDNGKGKKPLEPQACIWVNQHGKGRVFATTLGHHNSTVSTREYLDLLGNAVKWVMGQ
jgi:type 1 glutamine amidotransferase